MSKKHVHLGIDVKDSQGNSVAAWIKCDPDLPTKKPKAWAALKRMMQLIAEEVEKELKP